MTNKDNKGFVITRDGLQEFQKPKVILNKENQILLAQSLKFDALDDLTTEQGQKKFDSAETTYLRDELTATVKETMDTWYPDFTARQVFKFVQKGGLGVTHLDYDEKNWTGKAKIVGITSNDAPKISKGISKNKQRVFNLELDAEFTIYQLESARLGNQPLDADILKQTKFGHEWAINDLVYGISDDDNANQFPSVFNQMNKFITNSDTPDLNNHDILSGTATDNKEFLFSVVNSPEIFTNKMASAPTKLVLPIAQAKLINSQELSEYNDKSVAQLLIERTTIKEIIGVPELADVQGVAGVKDAMLILNDNQDIGEVIETVPYMMLPAQAHRTRFIITTRSSVGGLFIYKKAWAMVKNVGN